LQLIIQDKTVNFTRESVTDETIEPDWQYVILNTAVQIIQYANKKINSLLFSLLQSVSYLSDAIGKTIIHFKNI